MLKKFSNRLISFILAVTLLVVSLPTTLYSFADDFIAENLFTTKLESATGILMDVASGAVSENNRFDGNGALAASYDGDTVTAVDVYGALDWSPSKYVGAQYKLTEALYAGIIKIYSGFNAYQETYDVYASDKLSDLYSGVNKVGSEVICGDDAVTVTVNKRVQYVAFVCTSYNGNMRVKEFELWSVDESDVPVGFVSENILPNVQSASGILYQISTGIVTSNSKFDENGAIAASTDGDATVHKDIYGWDSDHMVGVLYTLDSIYYCGEAVIYSGFDTLPDKWTVYAAENLDDLYKQSSLVADSKTTSGSAVTLEINKRIKYIAFFVASDGARVKELELWTAEDPDKPFVSENAFSTKLQSVAGVNMFVSNGTTESSDRFNGNGAIAISTDGDKTTHADVYGALDWDPARYVGAVYTLSEAVYGGKIMIYSGYDTAKDTYRVYASNSMAELYSQANMIADGVVCGDSGVSIDVNKEVRFVAFFCTAFNGNQRIKEFELWTAEKPVDDGDNSGDEEDDGEDNDTAVKVLTIGNSFAENASGFATEIAAAQNHNLTFGYIKYPSCSIAQHYENAINDNSIYKFAVTEYNGSVSRTTIKDGSSTFATVKEALEYTDWDIVVIQQASTASYTYDTYEKADELIAFAQSVCPKTEIMLHETWSWATWAEDSVAENNFKYIEDCYHKLSKDNGNLKIIPTGRAFEFARREGILLNDSDNQHANAYGQYIAGACYAAVIFGANILENTFGDNHPYFEDVDLSVLRTAVMNAVNFQYDPNTNWDWADGKDDSDDSEDTDATNFIKRHLDSVSEISQDIASGAFAETVRFSAANANACNLAIDGDTANHFDVWGALDWEYPRNVGVMYKLDGSYDIDEVLVWAGLDGIVTKLDIYAADSIGTLYSEENRIAHNIECTGSKISIPLDKQISCIAFVITGYEGTAHITEFDITGSDTPIVEVPIIWPQPPEGESILKDVSATKIAAIEGDYEGTTVSEYKLVDGQEETDLSVLTDGNIEIHYDIWSLGANDKPGVLYDLGAYYNLTHLHAWAGAFGSELIVNNGYKIYASETLNDLYKTENLIFDYTNADDATNEVGVDISLKRIKYVAFMLTNSTDGGWRMREFAAYGEKSEDQSQAVEPEIEPDKDDEGNKADPNATNFIKRHLGSVSEIAQDIASGTFTELIRFSAANEKACQLAIDGDRENSFEVWGALDWEYPNNIGVMYKLDGSYIIDEVLLWAGIEGTATKLDVYASDSIGTLYSQENIIGHNIECTGSEIKIPLDKQISCVAFVITGYDVTAHITEFDLIGSDDAVVKEEITWPEAPESDNILKNSTVSKIIAPNANYNSIREFEYKLVEGEKETDLSVLTDGNLELHYDVWSLAENDKPGMLYDLGGYYDLTHLHAWSGAFGSELIVNNGYKIYASETFNDLYNKEKLILDYTNADDTTNEAAVEVSLKRIRYVAFMLTNSSDGAWRMREFAAYGEKSKDQTEAEEPDTDSADPNATNFIKRHLGSVSEIAQDVKSGTFTELVRFSAANEKACQLAIDGDRENSFEVWGALDWEYPNNIGVMYKLDGSYIIDEVLLWAGIEGTATKLDVYASDSIGTLYSEENRIGHNIECTGSEIKIPLDKQISCVAFVITSYDVTAHITEFDLIGSDEAVNKVEITWPEVPNGKNILKSATASKIIAPGGDYKGSKAFEYPLMEQETETDLSVLTDGNIEIHYDVWSLGTNDKPGVLYELDAYYDLIHLHAWAGAFGSELIVNNGYKIYASENLSDLYKTENLVLDYTNPDDTTNEAAIDISLKRIRYVAFILSSNSDGGWRMREFAAYGEKSADQTQAKEPTSIIEGIEAEYYGVATDNLADPIYMGASDYIIALTDGSRESVEFWGGADVENSTFVFIYNLYANYDLTGVDIYAFADSIEEDSGIHKGIRSAKVYASRKFDELFTTKPLVMKEDYADPKAADENSYYSADALTEWKGVRYIAYVFTIGDSRYGACRLEELKAFGEMSAVQDTEEEKERLPQYIDIEAPNGVIARIFALNSTDDLSKLDAHLSSERSESEEELKVIEQSLTGYKALSLYNVKVTDSSGNTVNTGGRLIRLSIPENKKDISVACVDDFGAEIVSSGLLGECITVETATLRSYALVSETDANKVSGSGLIDGMWVIIITLGALALTSIGAAAIVAVKTRK